MPSIIHTSDFHDRLTPELAARLRALKEKHGALLIDTGDAIAAPNIAVGLRGERAVELMNEAGYDALGLGNREFFFRKRGMAQKTAAARFVGLCANVRAREGTLPGIEPWTVLHTAGGVRVGLFGLMPTMIAPGHWFECFSDTRFIPWQDAAREAVAALTDRADLIVALYHRDAPAPDEPALAGVDLVLRGHSHVAPEHLERCGAAWCSRVGAFGSHARLIGITMPDRTVSLDRLIDLRAPETADG